MISKKINIGSGSSWYSEGWETLDNGPGDYSQEWQNKGKCWDTNLKSNSYDVVFTSHMLEHIPHFRLEKTISEFNRILKEDGILRIVVPDLKKMVNAYVKKDVNFYKMSRHYTDHLGIGGSFLSKLISPGKNTMAISREMDEIFGGYAHIYHFDYEMLEILLKKWGFKEIYRAKFCQSKDKDMQNPLCLIHNKKKYLLQSNFVRKKKFLKYQNWYHSGFDKSPETSLFVECKKGKNENYSYNKEFSYNKRNRFDSKEDKIKLFFIKSIVSSFDKIFFVMRKFKKFFNKLF
tara:strand:- start:2106 stop:2975 length:870 start_codon:yes stop_codon:yes gene_type:complete